MPFLHVFQQRYTKIFVIEIGRLVLLCLKSEYVKDSIDGTDASPLTEKRIDNSFYSYNKVNQPNQIFNTLTNVILILYVFVLLTLKLNDKYVNTSYIFDKIRCIRELRILSTCMMNSI